jgi:hypothetical protein
MGHHHSREIRLVDHDRSCRSFSYRPPILSIYSRAAKEFFSALGE